MVFCFSITTHLDSSTSTIQFLILSLLKDTLITINLRNTSLATWVKKQLEKWQMSNRLVE